MRAFVTVGAVVGVGVLVLQGCSGGLCSYSKKCPNDPQPTPQEIQSFENQCRAYEDMYATQPCFGEAESYASCRKNTVVCTSAGTYDSRASEDRAKVDCSRQAGDLLACCLRNSTSRICGK